MSLATKLIKGSTVTLLEHVLKLGFMFVTTPLMIEKLGERDYGTWLLALAIVTYFRLLDLGLSFSGTRFLGRALGAEDDAQFRILARSLFLLFRRIALITLTVTAVTVAVLPAFLENSELAGTIRLLVAGFGLATAVRFLTRISEVVLKSHVRYDSIGLAAAIRTLLQGSLIIGFLLAGCSLNTLLLIHFCCDLLEQAFLVLLARRIEPRVGFIHQPESEKTEFLALIRYAATATAASAGQSLRNGIDPLIVAKVAGVETVPVYSVGARFLTVFTDLINAIFGGNFVAAFSQLDGRNEPAVLKDRFLDAIRYCTAVAAIGGSGLAIFGPAFIQRWVGEEFAQSSSVLLILVPATTLSLMQYPIWSFFYSQHRQHWLATLTLAGGCLNLILSLVLAHQVGFMGVVWATTIEIVLLYALVIPFLIQRLFAISLIRYLGTIAANACKIMVPAFLYYLLIRPFIAASYLNLSMLATGLILLTIASIFWFVLREPERRKAMKKIGALPIFSSST